MYKIHNVRILFLISCLVMPTNFIIGAAHSLIPRSVLFGNPEKAYPTISPDGKNLAYCAPAGGALNVWVKTIGNDDDKAVTHEAKRGISRIGGLLIVNKSSICKILMAMKTTMCIALILKPMSFAI